MEYRQPGFADDYTYYNDITYSDTTQPLMPSMSPTGTGPLPPFVVMPRQTRSQRFAHRLGHALEVIVNKFNRLLALALTAVLLLLAGRFLLIFFSLAHSLFSRWMFLVTSPLMYPFANLAPTISYNGYVIDISTLVGMMAYIVIVLIVRRFLRILVTKE